MGGTPPTPTLLLRLKARRKRKRRAAGLRVHCGYDVRATPDPAGPRLERCPECGRERPEEAKSA